MTPDEDDFAAMLAEFEGDAKGKKGRARGPQVGDQVKGRVISVGQDTVFVDLGTKSEGVLDLAEFRDEEGKIHIAVGDEIEARVVDTGGASGIVLRRVLGGARGAAGGPEAQAELLQAFELGIPVEGVVTAVNKGGVEVQVGGQRAFCPISQLDTKHVEDANAYVGGRFTFRITKYEAGRREMNLVLSRRSVLEEEQKKRADQTRARLAVGAVLRGTITSIKDYGAFVDLGGIEGMLHVSELGFARVAHPSEVLSVGQEVECQVLKIEKTGDARRPEKIALSLKALEKDPWADVADRFSEGMLIHGMISRTESFGAFVTLAPGVEGLLHLSEIAGGRKVAHARQVMKTGAAVDVVIREIDRDRRRIGLTLAPRASDEDDAAAPQATSPQAGARQGFGTFADLLKKKEPKK
jgi:small subunit ribosomal protein S1